MLLVSLLTGSSPVLTQSQNRISTLESRYEKNPACFELRGGACVSTRWSKTANDANACLCKAWWQNRDAVRRVQLRDRHAPAKNEGQLRWFQRQVQGCMREYRGHASLPGNAGQLREAGHVTSRV